MADRPPTHLGMRHIALNIENLTACRDFYVEVLGLKIIWQPDADNIYLTSGNDNVALHKATKGPFTAAQRLDHLGFLLQNEQAVDEWYAFMMSKGVVIKAPPKKHRDGSKSFYCADPDGNVVQMIFIPEDAI